MAYDLGSLSSRKQSPYLSYGGGQILKVNKIELVKSQSTDSSKAVLHMETEPIKDATFEPIQGAKGRVGKVGVGVYMKHERQKEEFLKKMKDIAIALGLEEDASKISGDSFEEVVSELETLISGKYARFTVFGEEYTKSNTTVGLRLMLPRWNFVEPVDVRESTIIEFDVNNPLHLKKIRREDTGMPASGFSGNSKSFVTEGNDSSDLPF